jgi:hypothetical protein
MNDNTVLTSKSETIGVLEIRSLMEISQTMNKMLTYEEYHRIAAVYGMALDRLLKENDEV